MYELAHAAPLVLAGGGVRVTIGSDSGRTIHVGPLTMTVGENGVRTFMQYGYYEPNRRHSLRVRAVSVASRPLMTVGIVSVLGVMLYRGVGEPPSFVLTFVFSTNSTGRSRRSYRRRTPAGPTGECKATANDFSNSYVPDPIDFSGWLSPSVDHHFNERIRSGAVPIRGSEAPASKPESLADNLYRAHSLLVFVRRRYYHNESGLAGI